MRDALRQINPLCALDFYVHESCQRNGFGKQIFEAMLEQEGLEAWQLAYDRPSPKFLAFLSKYYGLSRYQPQNNNFVVFEDFFESDIGQGRTRSVTQSRRSATESSGAERPLEQDMTHLSPRQRMLKRQASEARPPMNGLGNGCSENQGLPSVSESGSFWDAIDASSARSNREGAFERPAAGMPSERKVQSGSSSRSEAYFDQTLLAGRGIGTNSSRRFVSPLSHAGQRVLAR